MTATERIVVVTGATGRQGGAVARHLLRSGWVVRALTRNPRGAAARALEALGATVVHGNMDDPDSLRAAFEGAHRVYSVQNPYTAGGPEQEVGEGRNVGDAARAAGVRHFVFGSAGIGRETGVPSWDSKLRIEEHLRALGLPLTVLRPTAFMELMSDKGFSPPIAVWHVMPKVMGSSRKVVWLSVDDLGAIAARVFADPERFIGKDLPLASDERSIDECRALHRAVFGKSPPRFPMPPWVFERFGFVGRDLSTMWRWLRTGDVEVDVEETRAVHPEALTVEAWMRRQIRA